MIDPGHLQEDRCAVCKAQAEDCSCSKLPRVSVPLRFVLIQHYGERFSSSNTGAILEHLVEGTEIVTYARRDTSLDLSALRAADTDYFVLYPQPGCPRLDADITRSAARRRSALILLDATWRQSRRMYRRLSELRQFRTLCLPEDCRPKFALRRPLKDGQLSTVEAGIQALDAMTFHDAAHTLREAYATIARRVLKERGRRSVSSAASPPPSTLPIHGCEGLR